MVLALMYAGSPAEFVGFAVVLQVQEQRYLLLGRYEGIRSTLLWPAYLPSSAVDSSSGIEKGRRLQRQDEVRSQKGHLPRNRVSH